jgi:hypothetical protein
MKTTVVTTLLLISMAAHSMCYTVFDASDRMIFRSTKSPVSLSGSMREAVQERFPGATMTITNEICQPYDRIRAQAEQRARADEAVRQKALKDEAGRATAEQIERLNAEQRARAAAEEAREKEGRAARAARAAAEAKRRAEYPETHEPVSRTPNTRLPTAEQLLEGATKYENERKARNQEIELTPAERREVDAAVKKAMERDRCSPGLFGRYFQECILDRAPSAGNAIAVGTIVRECQAKSPCRDVPSPSDSMTLSQCFKKYGEKLTEPNAARLVYGACRDLYVDR